MIQMTADNAVEETIVDAPVLETMEDIADDNTVEAVEVPVLTGAVATLEGIIEEMNAILVRLDGMKNIVGKADYKKTSVQLRKDLRPFPEKVMQVWRDIHTETVAAMDEVPSARKQKTPEDIQAEIDKLQARLAAAQA